MKKENGYFIRGSKFLGSDEFGYNYELRFNKSLENISRFRGMEKGLDDYVRREKRIDFFYSIIEVWNTFIDLFKK